MPSPQARRKAQLIALGALLVAVAASIWPILPMMSFYKPYVLGLPFALMWLSICIGLIFFIMFALYRFEYRGSRDDDNRGQP